MVSRVKRIGREPKFAIGRDGKPIIGLSFNKANETYYATYSKPRKYFGRDFDNALVLFRSWEAKQKGATVKILDPKSLQVVDALRDKTAKEITVAFPAGADFDADDSFEWIKANFEQLPEHVKQLINEGRGGTIFLDRQSWGIPEDIFWAWVRQEITTNPQLAAEKTGLPLDRLHQFKPLQPSPTLQSLIDLFIAKANITVDWRRKSKQYFDEFKKTVKVASIRQLTQQSIAEYYDSVIEKEKSPTYCVHRFGAIKRVFNFARQRGINPEEIRTVLDYLAILQPPKKNGNNPHPISVTDFHKLLNVADDKWKALLISSLNFCMYAVEISRVEKSEIDFDKQTLVTQRDKTGVTRVAVLWNRTIEALKKLPANQHTHIILSREGAPFDAEGIRTAFRKLRTKAGLPDTVKFSDIRDGAYSAAIEQGADLLHSKLLAGHETGITDAYVRRNPSMVADACIAVEKHYFGGMENPTSNPKGKTPSKTTPKRK